MTSVRNVALVAVAVLAAGCPKPPPPGEPDPSRSEIAVDRPSGAMADGLDQVQIRVTVRDSTGAPVSGVQVQVAASGTGNALVQPTSPSDAQGLSVGLLATTVPERKTVTATLPQGPFSSQATVEFTASQDVVGTRIIHYFTEDGVTDRADDLSGALIGAYVADAAGTYTYYPGTGTDAGTFRIPSVPPGEYLLQYGNDYIATSARVVDLSTSRPGRPDVARADAGTMLHAQISGMAPWTPNPLGPPSFYGSLHMTSPSAGLFMSDLDQRSVDGGQPAGGDTSLDLVRAYPAGKPLIDASRGDRTYINQFAVHDAGFTLEFQNGFWMPYMDSYKSVENASGPLAVTVVEGQLTELSAVLSPAPRQHFPVSWYLDPTRPGSFASFRLDVSPNASDTLTSFFYIEAGPSSSEGSFGTEDLVLMLLEDHYDVHQPDQQLVFEYGDPFPLSWNRYASAQTMYYVPLPAPGSDAGTTGTFYANGFLGVWDRLQTFPASPLKPQVSPVGSPLLEGASLFSDQALSSNTPLIRWSPPALGFPTYYTVRIGELVPNASPKNVARLHTSGTQLRMPPGIFQSGRSYNVVVRAVIEPGKVIATAPFLSTWPVHSADAVGGLLTVP